MDSSIIRLTEKRGSFEYEKSPEAVARAAQIFEDMKKTPLVVTPDLQKESSSSFFGRLQRLFFMHRPSRQRIKRIKQNEVIEKLQEMLEPKQPEKKEEYSTEEINHIIRIELRRWLQNRNRLLSRFPFIEEEVVTPEGFAKRIEEALDEPPETLSPPVQTFLYQIRNAVKLQMEIDKKNQSLFCSA